MMAAVAAVAIGIYGYRSYRESSERPVERKDGDSWAKSVGNKEFSPTKKEKARHRAAWNFWLEAFVPDVDRRDGLDFTPRAPVRNRPYTLVVNLAALSYAIEGDTRVSSRPMGQGFERWLNDHPDRQTADVSLRLIADKAFFPSHEAEKTMRIDLARMRAVASDGMSSSESPFETLRTLEGDAPFSFGLARFAVQIGDRVGRTSLALSVWVGERPVDDLEIPVCVAPDDQHPCDESESIASATVVRSLDLASAAPSDATLDLIPLGEQKVVADFRCRVCGGREGRSIRWEIPESAEWLAKTFAAIAENVSFAVRADNAGAAGEAAGDEIYGAIFRQSRDASAVEAARLFSSFVAESHRRLSSGGRPRSLFVRLVSRRADLVLAPIGLMRVPMPGDQKPEFVGFCVIVQTPLPEEDSSRATVCIADWQLFVPPALAEKLPQFQAVAEARGAFERWIEPMRRSHLTSIFEHEESFRHWLGGDDLEEPSALLIVSHHKPNALYLNGDTEQPAILASDVLRGFALPSLVILDACGTSSPSSSEFIRQFNSRGVHTIIATSHAVAPAMAGRFVDLFWDRLRAHRRDAAYTVGMARFEVVTKLRDSFGSQALAFMLAGNDTVRACLPPGA